MKSTAAPFVIERSYRAPIDRVWKAITEKEQMKQWYFDLAEFKPEVGFEFRFDVKDGDMLYIHLCRVMEVIPGKKISYSWRYKDQQGDSLVTWELFEEGSETRLKLTHSGLETFPPTKAFARENFEKGWTDILGASLKKYLEA